MTTNELESSQIEKLLRDVEIPRDLKDRLRAIPDPTFVDRPANVSPQQGWLRTVSSSPVFWVMALAASLLVLVGLCWDNPAPRGHQLVQSVGRMAEVKAPGRGNSGTIQAREEMRQRFRKLNAKRKRLMAELQAIESRETDLALDDYLSLQFPDPGVEPVPDDRGKRVRDQTSLIYALADQAVIHFGGSEKFAAVDMANVIRKFPQSQGAEFAQQFIDRLDVD